MFTLLSCSSKSTSIDNTLHLELEDGKRLEIPDSFAWSKLIPLKLKEDSATLFALRFKDFKQASQYAMERRLLILRRYETFIEPYFGTPSAEECQSNVDSTKLDVYENKLITVLTILTFGKDRMIKDCLLMNNTDWVRIELLVCGDTFYDIRTYFPVSGPRPEYKQTVFCKR